MSHATHIDVVSFAGLESENRHLRTLNERMAARHNDLEQRLDDLEQRMGANEGNVQEVWKFMIVWNAWRAEVNTWVVGKMGDVFNACIP